MASVDTSVVKELLSTSVRVRIPMNIPDYAGIVERLLDDLGTIADQAMQDAYTQARRDVEEVYANELASTTEGRRLLDEINDATEGLDDLFEE